jgi:hypothetical protein
MRWHRFGSMIGRNCSPRSGPIYSSPPWRLGRGPRGPTRRSRAELSRRRRDVATRARRLCHVVTGPLSSPRMNLRNSPTPRRPWTTFWLTGMKKTARPAAMDGSVLASKDAAGPHGRRGGGSIRLIAQRSTGQGPACPRKSVQPGAAFPTGLNVIIISEPSAKATRRARTGQSTSLVRRPADCV